MTDIIKSNILVKQDVATKGSWASQVAAPLKLDLNAQKDDAGSAKNESFVSKLIPKSKKGKVVFAAVTAQVVSMSVVWLAGYAFQAEKKPKAITDLEDKLMGLFTKNEQKLSGFLHPEGWNGFLDMDDRQQLQNLAGVLNDQGHNMQHKMQASKFIEFATLGALNTLSTIGIRNVLDKKMDINQGSGNVVKTQMIDTVTGLGTMFLIPKALPEQAKTARGFVNDQIMNIPFPRMSADEIANPSSVKNRILANSPLPVTDKQQQKLAKSAAFAAVNITLPDMVGFATGLYSMLKDVDEQDKAQKAKAAIEQAHLQR